MAVAVEIIISIFFGLFRTLPFKVTADFFKLNFSRRCHSLICKQADTKLVKLKSKIKLKTKKLSCTHYKKEKVRNENQIHEIKDERQTRIKKKENTFLRKREENVVVVILDIG